MAKDPTAEERARSMTARKVLDEGEPNVDKAAGSQTQPTQGDQGDKPDPITLTPDMSTKQPAQIDLEAEEVDVAPKKPKVATELGRGPGVQKVAAKSGDAVSVKAEKSAEVRAQNAAKRAANAKKKRAEAAKAKAQAREQVRVLPAARTVGMKQRHWGLVVSFALLVCLPVAALSYYLWTFAEDQYGSTTGFAVRAEEAGSASDLFTGLLGPAGGTTARDSDILYEYVRSQEIVEEIDAELNLRAHYSEYWPTDWMFSIWPDVSLEWLVWYWSRITRISYDQPTGLMEVRVVAFDADYAQSVARAVVQKSQARINDISIQAREDAMRYALEDADNALENLRAARGAMSQFRTRTGIVDPAADIQSRLGVMNNLQQSLADALIEYDLLRDTASPTDPRVTNAQRRIEVIRERIAAERQTFASDSSELGGLDEDYPSLISEFESLTVDREFAEQSYATARAALDLARDNAARQSRYLATYIQPTHAETPEFPRRFVLTGLATLFLLMTWGIITLVFYSVRDRG